MSRKRLFQAAAAFFLMGISALGTQAPALASANVTYVKIYAEQADKCLDNPQNSLANDTGMDIYTCLTPLPQNEQWVQDPAAHAGYYYFYNVKSQKCLTVQGASKANYAFVIQYTCNNGLNQEWAIQDGAIKGPYVTVQLRNYNSQLCLTVKGGNVANNTLVQQYTCNYGANQSWDVTNF